MAANAATQTPPATTALDTKKPERLIAVDESQFSNLLDTGRYEHMWRVAQMYASSKIVPQHFQGSAPDCFIALQMAVRLGVDPFMFMQKTFVVNGKPGMEAQLAIALVNSRGPFTGPIQWKMEGEGMSRKATAFAVHAVTNEICECTVSMQVAEAEGWLGKAGSKWKTMPDQMLRYRSAAWLARLYAPECLMGMSTNDELEDQPDPIVRRVVNTADGAMGVAKLAAMSAAAPPAQHVEPGPSETSADKPEAPKGKTKPATPKCHPGREGCSKEPGGFTRIKIGGKMHTVCAEHAAEFPADPK